ncbi:MAG: hypothetical protein JWM99_5046 [Verrucomicrobiales bacterium]|nr:hypothetical protein [Verrucomicrobiales bacterium]
MKQSLYLQAACLSALIATPAAWADQVTLDQVPPAVRNSIQSQSANGPVKKIEKLNRNGKTVYEVGFAQAGGLERDLYFDESGAFVRGNNAMIRGTPNNIANSTINTNGIPVGRGTPLTLKELPEPVLRTVNTETSKGPVTKVDQMFYNGRTVYRVAFQPGGKPEEIVYLNTDGTYLNNEKPNQGFLARARAAQPKLVNLADLPGNVRNTVNSETSNGPVKNIEDIPYNGRTVYKVAYQKPDGTEKLIYLNHDGSYVQDAQQTDIGAPAATASASRTSLSNATKVPLEQLPAIVQQRLRAAAAGSAIEDIDKGTLNGKTVYEAAFKQGEKTVELRVDELGHIIPDSEDRSILSGRNR